MRSLLFVLLLCTCGRAQMVAQCTTSSNIEALALEAYLTNDLQKWDKVVENTRELPESVESSLLVAKVLFGAAGAAFSHENEDKAENYIDAMKDPLNFILDNNKNHPEANALYSGYLGMLIAMSPMKGMFYGSKSGKMAKKGVDKGPNSPIAHYFLGSSLYYTPTNWGGDPARAVVVLEKAKNAFPPTANGCDWFYLQTHALLGQAQLSTGDKAAARQTYLAALKLQPNFAWVEKVLLPELENAR